MTKAVRFLLGTLIVLRIGGVAQGFLPPTIVLVGVLTITFLLGPLVERTDPLARLWRWSGEHKLAISVTAIAVGSVLVWLMGISGSLGHAPIDVDEHRLASTILDFFRHGSVPHKTVEDYPGVYYWAGAAVFLVTYLGALMSESATALHEVPISTFVLAGRILNTILYAGIVVLAADAARRLHGRGAAVLSASLIAIAPIGITISTQFRNDTGLTVLVALAAWTSL